ncbi:L-serine ammonia-lyase, iron-sulfur-dependent, subunit alpha [Veillonella sp. DNF00869]|jgi:L-serine dehydratase, iron-sulfur-dependent, alpha subunit|uniref:L-serine ammonia-lyase, iron-sulfur-dependent, subunit alpha n=1 Tax=Veillonella sp. DNF00869 TaxID=1384081 RepID=UPI00078321F5|nr:L-serine ammonia-lyase, iron-sulfur-dependent, subunit alpha [Veillonella sp. DNF00869]KXB89531.1 L-serine dehydratase, iron-sulfur-dependent, alpha subunit [Veillonella sp. DNF00869]
MSYLYDTIEDIVRLADRESISFSEVVLRSEIESTGSTKEEVLAEIRRRIQIFKESVRDGIADTRKSKSGMSGGQAKQLDERQPLFLSDLAYRALRYAISVNEANAKMFRIVACPTAGACGILPGVMQAVGEVYECNEEAYVNGFLAAAGVGNVVTNQACVAGAVGGCQAEVGTAAAMASACAVAMMGGTTEEVVTAMTLCMKNVLGLVCDPVAGLVEVPCVKRNGIYAVHALASAEMAMAGLRSRIPADEVIGAMDSIGRALPEALRETSEGGLAKTKTGVDITNRLAHQK